MKYSILDLTCELENYSQSTPDISVCVNGKNVTITASSATTLYFDDVKDYNLIAGANISIIQENAYYVDGPTMNWENVRITKRYDLSFRVFGRYWHIVYKPSTILWWLKKLIKNTNQKNNGKN